MPEKNWSVKINQNFRRSNTVDLRSRHKLSDEVRPSSAVVKEALQQQIRERIEQ